MNCGEEQTNKNASRKHWIRNMWTVILCTLIQPWASDLKWEQSDSLHLFWVVSSTSCRCTLVECFHFMCLSRCSAQSSELIQKLHFWQKWPPYLHSVTSANKNNDLHLKCKIFSWFSKISLLTSFLNWCWPIWILWAPKLANLVVNRFSPFLVCLLNILISFPGLLSL